MNKEYECNFHAAGCSRVFRLWPIIFVGKPWMLRVRIWYRSWFLFGPKKGEAWGLSSRTLFEQSHYAAALLHWLTSFENSNQGGIQPLSTAKLLKWPKIQTLSLSESRSPLVLCSPKLGALSLSANIKRYSRTHNLTWDPTHNDALTDKGDQTTEPCWVERA